MDCFVSSFPFLTFLSPVAPKLEDYVAALNSPEFERVSTPELLNTLFLRWTNPGATARSQMLRLLLEKGAKPWENETVFEKLFDFQLYDLISTCLSLAPGDIKAKPEWTQKLLHNNQVQLVEQWLKKGLVVHNWREIPAYNYALHVAKSAEMVEVLLQAGCNPDQMNAKKQTPLEYWDDFMCPISHLENKGRWTQKMEVLVHWGFQQEQGLHRPAFNALPLGLIGSGNLSKALAWTALTPYGWNNTELGLEPLGVSPLWGLMQFLKNPSINPSQGKNVERVFKQCFLWREEIWDTEWAAWGLFLQNNLKQGHSHWLQQVIPYIQKRRQELEFQPTKDEQSNRWKDALQTVTSSMNSSKSVLQSFYQVTLNWLHEGALTFNKKSVLSKEDWHLAMNQFYRCAYPDNVLSEFFKTNWKRKNLEVAPIIQWWNFLDHQWPQWASTLNKATQEVLLSSRQKFNLDPPEGINKSNTSRDLSPQFKTWLDQFEIQQTTQTVSHSIPTRRI